ncbi:hypothetical protein D9M72_555910 [compost metagenome]
MGGADGAGELCFHLGLGRSGVASRVQLHRLCHQHGSLAVHLDAAAFINERGGYVPGAGPAGDFRPDQRVFVPAGPFLPAPAVEHPVDGAEAPVAVEDEGGADVPHPRIVQVRGEHLDGGIQVARGCADVVGGHHHGDRLELDGGVGDGGPHGPRGVCLLGGVAEGVAACGEGHPDALLRSRLGGHAPAAHAVTSK